MLCCACLRRVPHMAVAIDDAETQTRRGIRFESVRSGDLALSSNCSVRLPTLALYSMPAMSSLAKHPLHGHTGPEAHEVEPPISNSVKHPLQKPTSPRTPATDFETRQAPTPQAHELGLPISELGAQILARALCLGSMSSGRRAQATDFKAGIPDIRTNKLQKRPTKPLKKIYVCIIRYKIWNI